MNSSGNTPLQKDQSRLLVNMAAFMIVIAGLKSASALVIPVMISAFMAILCMPPIQWLKKKRVPTPIALVMVISMLLIVTWSMLALAYSSVYDFVQTDLNTLQEKITNLGKSLTANWSEGDEETWMSSLFKLLELNPDKLVKVSSDGTGQFVAVLRNSLLGITSIFTSVLSNSFMIILTMVFMVFEVSGLPAKFRMMPGFSEENSKQFEKIVQDIRQYMVLKTNMSLVTGILIAVWLKIFGVKYFVVWGLVAFLLNYIPTIGSILAAIPAVLIALLGTDANNPEHLAFGTAAITAVGYLLVNIVIGNIIEPRVMGKGLGLSALVVFLSMVFWGWVLGPVGMVLSVPLTTSLKIFLDNSERTRWIAILLGSDVVDGDENGPATEVIA